MPSTLHSAIAILADEEEQTRKNPKRHDKQKGGRGGRNSNDTNESGDSPEKSANLATPV